MRACPLAGPCPMPHAACACPGTCGVGVLIFPSLYPRRNAGLLHVCKSGRQYKAQEETWLVSGLQAHRHLSVTEDEARRCPCVCVCVCVA